MIQYRAEVKFLVPMNRGGLVYFKSGQSQARGRRAQQPSVTGRFRGDQVGLGIQVGADQLVPEAKRKSH